MSNQKNERNAFLKVVIIILIILSVLLLAGIFWDWYKSAKKQSDQDRLNELRDQKIAYENGIQKAVKNEWWIYIIARTLVALIIILLNFIFYWKWNDPLDYNLQINFNEVLVLGYSFLAFIIAGTPAKFVKLVRTTIYNIRKRAHVGQIDIDQVNHEILVLEERIKKHKAA